MMTPVVVVTLLINDNRGPPRWFHACSIPSYERRPSKSAPPPCRPGPVSLAMTSSLFATGDLHHAVEAEVVQNNDAHRQTIRLEEAELHLRVVTHHVGAPRWRVDEFDGTGLDAWDFLDLHLDLVKEVLRPGAADGGQGHLDQHAAVLGEVHLIDEAQGHDVEPDLAVAAGPQLVLDLLAQIAGRRRLGGLHGIAHIQSLPVPFHINL